MPYNLCKSMHIFRRARWQKHFNRLYLRVLSLWRDTTLPVPINRDLGMDRVSGDGPDKSESVASLLHIPTVASSSEAPNSGSHDHAPGNPCINGISTIIHNPTLSLLFGDFLQSTHCWENFAFYLEVMDFIACYEQIKHISSTLDISHGVLAALYRE